MKIGKQKTRLGVESGSAVGCRRLSAALRYAHITIVGPTRASRRV